MPYARLGLTGFKWKVLVDRLRQNWNPLIAWLRDAQAWMQSSVEAK